MSTYPYDGQNEQEYRRLLSLQAAYDAVSIQHLEERGILPGFSCLEIGAGAGSIALWMLRKVGPTGRCVATDINTEFLKRLNEPKLEIWEHDITRQDMPVAEFDLVHMRFLLDVLPDRTKALDTILTTLKPGGWLVVEEFDALTSPVCSSPNEDDVALYTKLQRAMDELWKDKKFDGEYGRKLPVEFHRMKLTDIGAQGHVLVRQGGTADVEPWRLSVERLRSDFIKSGLITEQEIDKHQELLMESWFFYFAPLRVIAWGRKPDKQ